MCMRVHVSHVLTQRHKENLKECYGGTAEGRSKGGGGELGKIKAKDSWKSKAGESETEQIWDQFFSDSFAKLECKNLNLSLQHIVLKA